MGLYKTKQIIQINRKKIFFLFIIVSFIITNIYSDKSVINNIFFDDFIKTGKTIKDNILLSAAFISFSLLTTEIIINNDVYLQGKIKETKNDFNNKFFDYINYAGDGIYVMAFNSILFLFSEKEKKTAENLLECLAVNGISGYILKIIFGRQRPSQTEDPRKFNFFSFGDNSMPSGHTLVAFTWAEVLNDSNGIWYLTYPVAMLAGYARLYKNAHWASDVFTGALLGIILTKINLNKSDNLEISFKDDLNIPVICMRF